ncbi:hypothetical protein JCM10449v2_000440 [Rhodotorula kratochvilovae]
MVEQAFKTRLEGNELFKNGNLGGALLKYHQVLLVLKGVNYPAKVVDPFEAPRSGVEEISDAEAAKIEAEKGKGKEQAESMADRIQNALMNTYLNSAAIYVKQERWQRALDSAYAAQKYDKENPKAKFREAQALIGLGQIYTGKKKLEELRQTNPDAAVTAALKKLAKDEAAREAKKNLQFKGMFDRKQSGSQNGKKPAGTSSTVADKDGANGKADTAAPVEAKEEQPVPPKAEAQENPAAAEDKPAATAATEDNKPATEDDKPARDETAKAAEDESVVAAEANA